MKKIMFNDNYGLTKAVIEGGKTMTRRIVPRRMLASYQFESNVTPGYEKEFFLEHSSYKVGEVVAIAQSYKDISEPQDEAQIVLDLYKIGGKLLTMEEMGAGWNNKMFVKSELMPYAIKITDIRAERLQDISNEDCIREGIKVGECGNITAGFMTAYYVPNDIQPYCTPRDAFASLIDRVSGKGTWESNPFVWVYSFEVIGNPKRK